ncbi:MAG TPA: hypothetical protein VHD57_11170 [Vicinamibacterales bacterium]|jgi:hypothetical protein|nr:hypothetical protein [Vicinamibacterales bacterium]
MKGLVRGTVLARRRDDLRPDIQMASSGRRIFFEADESRVLVVRILHDAWTTVATLTQMASTLEASDTMGSAYVRGPLSVDLISTAE